MPQPADANFNVAIVGAGPAGLALAMSLHGQNITFTLYEAAPAYSAVGAGIGFAPNGMRAMDLIAPGFRALYDGVCVGNKGGKEVRGVFFEGLLVEGGLGKDSPWYGRSSWGHPEFSRKSAHRKALLDIMTTFIPTSHVKFNAHLASIEPQADGVTLTFADGTNATHTLLAGADGIKSSVRAHVLHAHHPEQVAPVYAGSYCYRGVIPMAEAQEILGELTDVAKFYFGHKRAAVTYRISGGEEFNFLLCVFDGADAWTAEDAVTEKVSREAMMADFGGPGVDERFRQLLRKASPVKWGLFHHPETATYYRDRVVLIGDSAHASLPFQAAGAAQGLEDALVLSKVLAGLARPDDDGAVSASRIEAGLAAYDAVRRPRAQRQLEQSAEMARLLYFLDEEAGADMEKILPRLQRGRFEWLWFHDVQVDADEAVRKMREAVKVDDRAASGSQQML